MLRSPVHLIELDLLREDQRSDWEVADPPIERRRRGNALRGGARHLPEAGNTRSRAKGLSVSSGRRIGNTVWTLSQVSVTTSLGVELEI